VPEGRKRTAVLISGRGSNLSALIAACERPDYPAEISLVVSDSPGAGGLAHAAAAAIPTAVVNRGDHATKREFDAQLDIALRDAGTDLVCLAGFMRVLSEDFVDDWHDRLLNIHPSLLPLFPGLGTHRRALEAGVKIHGATVHFVRSAIDSGPIVAQGVIPVLPNDTPETLAARVLRVEHRIYPLGLRLVAEGRARVEGDRVVITGVPAGLEAALLSPED
jgi:phosphoribosylglycinamide formyltransferase-1